MDHLQRVKMILRYLQDITSLGLNDITSTDLDIIGFSNAYSTTSSVDRKYIIDQYVFLNETLIWRP